MKRIVMFSMSTLTVLVLLFGYHTSTSSKAAGGHTAFVSTAQAGSAVPAPAPATSAPTITTPPDSAASAPSGFPSTTSSATPGTSGSTSKAATGTVTGDVADTRWGPVQVQLAVRNRKITNVTVVQYPNGTGRDQEINDTALPILVQETITAQSAKIDMVSGATVTSEGYVNSLQSALDKM